MSKVYIGTSGWSYKSWRGPFFPKEIKVKDICAKVDLDWERPTRHG